MPYLILQKRTGDGIPGYDLSAAVYDGFFYALPGTAYYSLEFKPDGTEMYSVGDGERFSQFSLTTPWDISSGVSLTGFLDMTSFDDAMRGMEISSDGTRVFTSGLENDAVYQWNLSTPWLASSATYSGNTLLVGAQESNPQSVTVSSDGLKMYVAGNISDSVHQYTMTSAWDLSTATYDSVAYSVSSEEGDNLDVKFSSAGTKMFINGISPANIYRYSLSTAWDVSSASYDNNFINASTAAIISAHDFKRPNGDKMFVMRVTPPRVYSYTL